MENHVYGLTCKPIFFLNLQKELKEEDRRYREYLKKLIVEEKAKEAELDRLVNEEVERMWQKRLDQWALERKARKQLLDQVLQVRQGQIQDRCKSKTYPGDAG